MTSNEAAQFVGNAVERRNSATERQFTENEEVRTAVHEYREQNNNISEAPSVLGSVKRYVRSFTWRYPRVKGERFIPAKNKEELITYARRELGINAREFINDESVDLSVANALIAELWQAKKLFNTCGLINVIRTPTYEDMSFKDEKVWGCYVENTNLETKEKGETLVFRTTAPKDSRIKLPPYMWFNSIAKEGVSSKDWRHVFRHEIGHAIEAYVKQSLGEAEYNRRKNEIIGYWKTTEKLDSTQLTNFSLLADKDQNQIVAECVAHILCGGTSKIACHIITILTRKTKNDNIGRQNNAQV